MTHLRRNYCYTLLFLLAVCLSFTACVPEGIELPSRVKSIATDVATSVTSNGAKLCGVVSVYDTDTISCGIIYDTSSTLSSDSGKLKPTSANGKYSVSICGLKANTTYYYRAYALDAGVYKYGEVLSFATEQEVFEPEISSPESIDLGLSVQWASFNVGANSPEEYGNYFAWGETAPKSSYYRDSSVTYGLSISQLESRGIIGDDGNLTSSYDAATANWGEGWRIPTETEVQELIDECTWRWTTQNGVYGRKVTGPNGSSIFLPAAGHRGYSTLYDDGSYGHYWYATPCSNSDNAYYLSFGSVNVGFYKYYRFFGLVVRPVYSDVPSQVVTIETGEATNITAESATLNGVVSGADESISCGFIYGTSSDMSSQNNHRAEASSNGTYSVSISNLQANTTYYYCAYVIIDGEEKLGEVLSFTTEQEVVEPEPSSPEAIDLGLSVKWASFNVGANSPEDYGDYFAWGETTTKSDYSSSTSITYGLSISELESRGIIDAAGNLTAAYDAATANWGGNWRMPTLDEMKELVNECEWKRTYVNGVNGRLVTGPNGNSIFLPTAGYRLNELLSWTSYFGLYWSATPYSSSLSACNLDFRDDNYGWDDNTRSYGHVVRPVYSEEPEIEDSEVSNKTYTVNGVSFTMIGVEGGTFTIGSPDSDSDANSDEKPAHQVTLSSYSIGETEVTQSLWQAVMGSNPSYFTGDLQRPVEKVSWDDCQTFISKLNELTGENFRLPTEAEWEYAARGGNMSNGYKYSGSKTIDDVAWYDSNSSSTTHAVKTKQPNELGIYDMSGNVWEWCSDWYGSYSSSAQTNPTGPSSGFSRVLRGGSRLSSAEGCRVAIRSSNFSDSRGYNYGLRLALQFIP